MANALFERLTPVPDKIIQLAAWNGSKEFVLETMTRMYAEKEVKMLLNLLGEKYRLDTLLPDMIFYVCKSENFPKKVPAVRHEQALMIVRVLVEDYEVGLRAEDENERTVLNLALAWNPELARYLIQRGATINATSVNAEIKTQLTALLLYLCKQENSQNPDDVQRQAEVVKVAKVLVEDYEVDLEAKDKDDRTALSLAVTWNPGLVRYLIQRGANVNASTSKDKVCYIPLHFAIEKARNNCLEIVRLLHDNDVWFTFGVKNKLGLNAIQIAAFHRHLELFEYLSSNAKYSTQDRAIAFELLGSRYVFDDRDKVKEYWRNAIKLIQGEFPRYEDPRTRRYQETIQVAKSLFEDNSRLLKLLLEVIFEVTEEKYSTGISNMSELRVDMKPMDFRQIAQLMIASGDFREQIKMRARQLGNNDGTEIEQILSNDILFEIIISAICEEVIHCHPHYLVKKYTELKLNHCCEFFSIQRRLRSYRNDLIWVVNDYLMEGECKTVAELNGLFLTGSLDQIVFQMMCKVERIFHRYKDLTNIWFPCRNENDGFVVRVLDLVSERNELTFRPIYKFLTNERISALSPEEKVKVLNKVLHLSKDAARFEQTSEFEMTVLRLIRNIVVSQENSDKQLEETEIIQSFALQYKIWEAADGSKVNLFFVYGEQFSNDTFDQRYKMLKFFLNCGCDPNETDRDGNTALHLELAKADCDEQIVRLFTSHPNIHIDQSNKKRQRLDVLLKKKYQIPIVKTINLQCMVACCIKDNRIPYNPWDFPEILQPFIERH